MITKYEVVKQGNDYIIDSTIIKVNFNSVLIPICDKCEEPRIYKWGMMQTIQPIKWNSCYGQHDCLYNPPTILSTLPERLFQVFTICSNCYNMLLDSGKDYSSFLLKRTKQFLFNQEYTDLLFFNRKELKHLNIDELGIYINLETGVNLDQLRLYKFSIWMNLIDDYMSRYSKVRFNSQYGFNYSIHQYIVSSC